MATVTGMTAEKIVEITDDSVISASIDDATGVLTLQTRGGETITAGNVGLASAAVDKAYPVGSIFLSTIATNPNTQLGVGTWSAWGTGRVPVGVDDTQTEFTGTEKTGGEKSHILTANEMPSHQHGMSHAHDMSHDHGAANTSTAGSHEHDAYGNTTAGQDVGTYARGAIGGRAKDGGALIDTAGDHWHTFDVPPYSGGTNWDNRGGITDPSGGGAGHNNLQPYITCYMWKRTA